MPEKKHLRGVNPMNPNETRGDGAETEIEDVQSCPNCSKEPREWSTPQGYYQGRDYYCCSRCAEGAGCLCEVHV